MCFVQLYDVFSRDSNVHLVLELCDGKDLEVCTFGGFFIKRPYRFILAWPNFGSFGIHVLLLKTSIQHAWSQRSYILCVAGVCLARTQSLGCWCGFCPGCFLHRCNRILCKLQGFNALLYRLINFHRHENFDVWNVQTNRPYPCNIPVLGSSQELIKDKRIHFTPADIKSFLLMTCKGLE